MSLTNVLEPPAACRQCPVPRIPAKAQFPQRAGISGERLFLLYSHPCIAMGGRRLKRPIEAKERLVALVENGGDPDHALFRECFPDAVSSFEKFAGIDPSAGGPWPVEKVRGYWRQHKGWKGVSSCAVMRGMVEFVDKDSLVKINSSGKMTTVFNDYRLPVKKGDTVYVHQFVIVEVEGRG